MGGASGIVSRQTDTEWHGWHTTSTCLQNWTHTTRLVAAKETHQRNTETHCIGTPSSSASWALARYFAQQYMQCVRGDVLPKQIFADLSTSTPGYRWLLLLAAWKFEVLNEAGFRVILRITDLFNCKAMKILRIVHYCGFTYVELPWFCPVF